MKYYPERPCSNCFLCGKSNAYCSHFQSWNQHAQDFVKKYLGPQSPNPDGCICLSHYVEAKCNHPPSFVPKWKKSASPPEPPSQHVTTSKEVVVQLDPPQSQSRLHVLEYEQTFASLSAWPWFSESPANTTSQYPSDALHMLRMWLHILFLWSLG